MPIELISTAFLLGLASSGHCIFMCGGISCALSQSLQPQTRMHEFIYLLIFHFGRLSCYCALGIGFGFFLQFLTPETQITSTVLRTMAALLIILMGLYISGLNLSLKKLENQLSFIWKKIQPLTSYLMKNRSPAKHYALGFSWGFLPCGMIYSTVLWASTSSNASALVTSTQAAFGTGLLMFVFGLGTLPSLLALNIGSQEISKKLSAQKNLQHAKKAIGLLLIGFGIWSLLSIFLPMPSFLHGVMQHDGHSQHQH